MQKYHNRYDQWPYRHLQIIKLNDQLKHVHKCIKCFINKKSSQLMLKSNALKKYNRFLYRFFPIAAFQCSLSIFPFMYPGQFTLFTDTEQRAKKKRAEHFPFTVRESVQPLFNGDIICEMSKSARLRLSFLISPEMFCPRHERVLKDKDS